VRTKPTCLWKLGVVGVIKDIHHENDCEWVTAILPNGLVSYGNNINNLTMTQDISHIRQMGYKIEV